MDELRLGACAGAGRGGWPMAADGPLQPVRPE